MKTKFVKHPENGLPTYKLNVETESALYELKRQYTEKPNSKYWLQCFKCSVIANLGDHEVNVVNDVITISPSILCPRKECGNHYYIKNSEVIQA